MLALSIFIITLVFVIWQPRELGIGWSALGGAAVALATGVVTLADLLIVWDIVWDASFTFIALIIISLILDEAGFFSWAALSIAHHARGQGRLLLPLIVLLGALISALFANDGAALLLTPIVMAVLLQLRFPAPAALALIMACGFIADTASLPLVISNLVNIVSANFFEISFARYAAVMLPINLVSIATSLAVLWLAFGRQMPPRYPTHALMRPAQAIVDPLVFRAALPLLLALMAGYIVLAPWHVPFSFVTAAGAVILMLLAGRGWRRGRGAVIALGPVLRQAPWQIVLFSIGMYLVVYGLGQAGLTRYGAALLHWLAAQGPVAASVGTGFLAALLASVMNNLPATLAGALAIQQSGVDPLIREIMVYANVIGNDLGPKFTPIGSLATLLWLHVLARKGHRIGWGQYMKIGLLLTPPVLLASLLALAAWLRVLGPVA